jgi:hypothetical protein
MFNKTHHFFQLNSKAIEFIQHHFSLTDEQKPLVHDSWEIFNILVSSSDVDINGYESVYKLFALGFVNNPEIWLFRIDASRNSHEVTNCCYSFEKVTYDTLILNSLFKNQNNSNNSQFISQSALEAATRFKKTWLFRKLESSLLHDVPIEYENNTMMKI